MNYPKTLIPSHHHPSPSNCLLQYTVSVLHVVFFYTVMQNCSSVSKYSKEYCWKYIKVISKGQLDDRILSRFKFQRKCLPFILYCISQEFCASEGINICRKFLENPKNLVIISCSICKLTSWMVLFNTVPHLNENTDKLLKNSRPEVRYITTRHSVLVYWRLH